MDLVTLIIIIVVAVVLLGGAGAFFLSGRGGSDVLERPADVSTTLDPPSTEQTGTGTAVLDPPVVDDAAVLDDPAVVDEPVVEPEVITKPSFRERLAKARGAFAGYLGSILSRGVDAQTWEELEEALIRADVGVETTMSVLESVKSKADADKITDAQVVLDLLKEELKQRLGGKDRSLHLADEAPSVWLFVGVNGVGKTTTIGKLAKREMDDGKELVLAAGDTFRAAAAEQLETWAERSGAGFIRGAEGGDPSSVIFDAVEHAAAKGADVVLADTAGRLHNKSNLMDELRKVRRVSEKGAGTVSEVLLVLDATTGQNGLTQVEVFTEAVDVTGVVLTKLDGSAKGGIVLAIQDKLDIPVKLVGLGEGIGDLVEFDADEFVDALF